MFLKFRFWGDLSRLLLPPLGELVTCTVYKYEQNDQHFHVALRCFQGSWSTLCVSQYCQTKDRFSNPFTWRKNLISLQMYLLFKSENSTLLWCYIVYRRFEGLQYPRNAQNYSPVYNALHRRLKHPCFWNTTLCRAAYKQHFPKSLLHSSSEQSKPSSWTTMKMDRSSSETTAPIHNVINSHLKTCFSDYRRRKHLPLTDTSLEHTVQHADGSAVHTRSPSHLNSGKRNRQWQRRSRNAKFYITDIKRGYPITNYEWTFYLGAVLKDLTYIWKYVRIRKTTKFVSLHIPT